LPLFENITTSRKLVSVCLLRRHGMAASQAMMPITKRMPSLWFKEGGHPCSPPLLLTLFSFIDALARLDQSAKILRLDDKILVSIRP
jgi:hypothetical protein